MVRGIDVPASLSSALITVLRSFSFKGSFTPIELVFVAKLSRNRVELLAITRKAKTTILTIDPDITLRIEN